MSSDLARATQPAPPSPCVRVTARLDCGPERVCWMEGDMPEERTPERPKGPDLSGLRIDEGARGDHERFKWLRWLAAGLGALLLAAALVFALRGRTPVVEVAATRARGKANPSSLISLPQYPVPIAEHDSRSPQTRADILSTYLMPRRWAA
jgi:hypothetical protein